ncbi:hypothetical protein ACFV8Z_38165 [Streptomyces sp. NPDC059837]|uniref:hypothetical protein n=1 Tax=unclassified Streptomyces TaxID=2593676 RepID=UPI0036487097
MHSSYRAASSVLFAAVSLAGCSPATTGGTTASLTGTSATPSGAHARGGPQGAIAVGAGPQTTYTVQKQPPAGSYHFRYEKGEPLEDPACTPGAVSPAVRR